MKGFAFSVPRLPLTEKHLDVKVQIGSLNFVRHGSKSIRSFQNLLYAEGSRVSTRQMIYIGQSPELPQRPFTMQLPFELRIPVTSAL